ncbi:hypothetical protein BCR42DRAFT_410504, partial [Absidia repens]
MAALCRTTTFKRNRPFIWCFVFVVANRLVGNTYYIIIISPSTPSLTDSSLLHSL